MQGDCLHWEEVVRLLLDLPAGERRSLSSPQRFSGWSCVLTPLLLSREPPSPEAAPLGTQVVTFSSDSFATCTW